MSSWPRPTMSVTAAAVFLAALSGCGYRFAGSVGTLPEDVRLVRSPVFANQTAEPGLEVVFTRALREQLMRSGVETATSADAELQGELLGVWGGPTILATPPPGTNAIATLASYRIFATARLKLIRSGRVLGQTDVTGSEDYLPGVDVLQSEANRQAALQRLAERLMRDGFYRLSLRT